MHRIAYEIDAFELDLGEDLLEDEGHLGSDDGGFVLEELDHLVAEHAKRVLVEVLLRIGPAARAHLFKRRLVEPNRS
jgi:hypothetical protein